MQFEEARFLFYQNGNPFKAELAPTVDAVPVVHGRWDDSQSEIIGGLYHEVRECSECGWTYDMVIEFNYCPNCGANMRGTEDE